MSRVSSFVWAAPQKVAVALALDTQSDLFMKSLKYVANYIADQINLYMIPELVVWNYPTKNFPQLAVRNLGETRDLAAACSALGNLFAQEILTPDMATEQHVRKMFDIPIKLEARPTKEESEVQPELDGASKTGKGQTKPGKRL